MIPELGSLEPIDQELEQALLKNISRGIAKMRPGARKKNEVQPNQPTMDRFVAPKPPVKKD